MLKEEHSKILSDLRNAETDSAKAELILQIQTDYTEMLKKEEDLTGKCEALAEENKNLCELNKKMFLAMGQAEHDIPLHGMDAMECNEHGEPKKRSFTDLKW